MKFVYADPGFRGDLHCVLCGIFGCGLCPGLSVRTENFPSAELIVQDRKTC